MLIHKGWIASYEYAWFKKLSPVNEGPAFSVMIQHNWPLPAKMKPDSDIARFNQLHSDINIYEEI